MKNVDQASQCKSQNIQSTVIEAEKPDKNSH